MSAVVGSAQNRRCCEGSRVGFAGVGSQPVPRVPPAKPSPKIRGTETPTASACQSFVRANLLPSRYEPLANLGTVRTDRPPLVPDSWSLFGQGRVA